MDDKDERELKLEIVCLTFSSFNTMPEKFIKTNIMVSVC